MSGPFCDAAVKTSTSSAAPSTTRQRVVPTGELIGRTRLGTTTRWRVVLEPQGSLAAFYRFWADRWRRGQVFETHSHGPTVGRHFVQRRSRFQSKGLQSVCGRRIATEGRNRFEQWPRQETFTEIYLGCFSSRGSFRLQDCSELRRQLRQVFKSNAHRSSVWSHLCRRLAFLETKRPIQIPC